MTRKRFSEETPLDLLRQIYLDRASEANGAGDDGWVSLGTPASASQWTSHVLLGGQEDAAGRVDNSQRAALNNASQNI